MCIIAEVADALHKTLTPISLRVGRESKCIRRQSKRSGLDGAKFVQTLVLGWLHNPDSSLMELAQTAAMLGVTITAQGLAQRFTPSAVECVKQVLQEATRLVLEDVAAPVPLLQRFSGVYVQDSSVIPLPRGLAERWPGCGTRDCKTASLKIHVCWELLRGHLKGPLLSAGKEHDRASELDPAALPPGSLWLADLGFFNSVLLAELSRLGVYWLTRVQAGTTVRLEGRKTKFESLPGLIHRLARQSPGTFEVLVEVGQKADVLARLFVFPVPPAIAAQRRVRLEYQAGRKAKPVSLDRDALCDWNIFITNVPSSQLSGAEAVVLYRTRWQIERLFRLWKEWGGIDNWRSIQLPRIECEIYAKLLAMVLQHWIMVCGNWTAADRSLHHMAKTIRKHAVQFAGVLHKPTALRRTLKAIVAILAHTPRIQKRNRAPANFQLLLDPPETGYA